MRKLPAPAFLLAATLAAASASYADTYATFSTRRYYSPGRRFFVEVTERKRATLYRNGRALRRVWSRTLDELPGDVIVTDGGSRVVLVDFYYGNLRDPEATVLAVLDARGNRIAGHRLRELIDLKRAFQTVSTALWRGPTRLSPDGRFLEIETAVLKDGADECVKKAGRQLERWPECWEPTPYQRLRFDLASGALVERRDLAGR